MPCSAGLQLLASRYFTTSENCKHPPFQARNDISLFQARDGPYRAPYNRHPCLVPNSDVVTLPWTILASTVERSAGVDPPFPLSSVETSICQGQLPRWPNPGAFHAETWALLDFSPTVFLFLSCLVHSLVSLVIALVGYVVLLVYV